MKRLASDLAPLRVLVVDDLGHAAETLKRRIEQRFVRYHVVCEVALTLTDALEYARSTRFGLVLLDLNLDNASPDLASAHEQTLQHVLDFGCPVIAMSGVEDEGLISAALQAKCIDFIIKGVHSEAAQMDKIGIALDRYSPGRGVGREVYRMRTNFWSRIRSRVSKNFAQTVLVTIGLCTFVGSLSGAMWRAGKSGIRSSYDAEQKLAKIDPLVTRVDGIERDVRETKSKVSSIEQNQSENKQQLDSKLETINKTLQEAAQDQAKQGQKLDDLKEALAELKKDLRDRR